jgi:septum formation protein
MKNQKKSRPQKIILASQSPRRQEMLRTLGIRFEVVLPYILERWKDRESPRMIARNLAIRKARKCRVRNALVIAMDTLVVLGNKKLGKPVDETEAREMLQTLSGKKHRVITGIALLWKNQLVSDAAVTEVEFRKIDPEEIEWYLQTGEPFDKAGAYAIQGYGRIFINGIHGCYYNVVGFPLSLFQRMLRRFNLTILDLQDL